MKPYLKRRKVKMGVEILKIKRQGKESTIFCSKKHAKKQEKMIVNIQKRNEKFRKRFNAI